MVAFIYKLKKRGLHVLVEFNVLGHLLKNSNYKSFEGQGEINFEVLIRIDIMIYMNRYI